MVKDFLLHTYTHTQKKFRISTIEGSAADNSIGKLHIAHIMQDLDTKRLENTTCVLFCIQIFHCVRNMEL